MASTPTLRGLLQGTVTALLVPWVTLFPQCVWPGEWPKCELRGDAGAMSSWDKPLPSDDWSASIYCWATERLHGLVSRLPLERGCDGSPWREALLGTIRGRLWSPQALQDPAELL